MGGGQIGCNYQFSGGWIFGLQVDFDKFSAKASNRDLTLATNTNTTQQNWLGAVTPRFGYAWDSLLGYIKGGGALTSLEFSSLDTVPPPITGKLDRTRSGWTVGVGAEYAVTKQITGFVEYDYYNFGTINAPLALSSGPLNLNQTFTNQIKVTNNVVKAGVNWRY